MSGARYIEELTPVSIALEELKGRVRPVGEWFEVPVWDAVGLVVARDVRAPVDWPPYARSAYDGYAVRSEDTPGRLRVVGEELIGGAPRLRIGPGEAAYVTTGSYIPEGADTVVPEEKVKRLDDNHILVEEHYPPGSYLDSAGSIVRKGMTLLKSGTVLTWEDVAGLLEVAVTEVPVYRSVRVAIVSTGNELIYPSMPALTAKEILEGKVVATTGDVIEGFMRRYTPWVEVIGQTLLPDDREAVAWHIERVLPLVDVVLVTGGTGPSRIDLFYQLQDRLGGELVFRGLYVIGGKPTSAYVVEGKPVVGLSGYPISALHAMIRLVYPLLQYMGNVRRPSPPLPLVEAELEGEITPKRPRPIKVRLEYRNDKIIAIPLDKRYQKSSANVGFLMADGLALTGDRPLKKGDKVTVFLLRQPRGYKLPWLTP
ncbi:MAG: molybdopterin molybdotransferase MoeA [Desulfurococcales archaeon]|nr:molybdopterin molybdotransferase MoeA [Desulfurococcales archaeon]